MNQSPRPRGARTARAILDAATTTMAARGPADASVEAIARSANVSVGSIYVHFGSKEALYLAVVGAAFEHATEMFEPAAHLAELDRARDCAAEAFLEFARSEPAMFRLVAAELLDRGARPVPLAEHARFIRRLAEILEPDAEAGSIVRATALLGAWAGAITSTERIADRATGYARVETVRGLARVLGSPRRA